MLKKSKIKIKRRNTEPSMLMGPGSLEASLSISGHHLLAAAPSSVNTVHEEEDADLLELSESIDCEESAAEHSATSCVLAQESQRPTSRAEADGDDFWIWYSERLI